MKVKIIHLLSLFLSCCEILCANDVDPRCAINLRNRALLQQARTERVLVQIELRDGDRAAGFVNYMEDAKVELRDAGLSFSRFDLDQMKNVTLVPETVDVMGKLTDAGKASLTPPNVVTFEYVEGAIFEAKGYVVAIGRECDLLPNSSNKAVVVLFRDFNQTTANETTIALSEIQPTTIRVVQNSELFFKNLRRGVWDRVIKKITKDPKRPRTWAIEFGDGTSKEIVADKLSMTIDGQHAYFKFQLKDGSWEKLTVSHVIEEYRVTVDTISYRWEKAPTWE